MEHTHRDKCAIVGIGATDFSRDSGRSELTPGDRRPRWRRWPTPASRPPTSTGSSAATWTTCAATTSPTASASATSRTSARTAPVGRRRARWSARRSPRSCPGRRRPCSCSAASTADPACASASRPVDGARVGGAGTYDELFAPYGLLTPGPDLRPDGPAPHDRVRHRRPSSSAASPWPAGRGPTPTRWRRCTTAR